MRRLRIPAAALALALLLAPGWKAGASAERAKAAYRLDLRRLSEGVAEVRLELETNVGQVTLRMDDSIGGGLVADLPSHLRGLKAYSEGGEEIAATREGGTWLLAGGGALTVSYEVDLTSYRAGTPYLEGLSSGPTAWPYFPLLREDLAFIPGFALFLRPDPPPEGGVGLEVELPEGWEVVSPPGGEAPGLDSLLGNPVLAGRLVTEERGSFVLSIPESSAPAPAVREEFSSRLRSVLSRASALPGGGWGDGGDRLWFFLLPHGEGDRLEDSFFPSWSYADTVVVPLPADADVLSEACLEAATRGAAALALSSSLRLEPEARWLLEGAGWYLQDLLLYEAGIWGGPLFWDRFNSRYQAYRRAREALALSPSEAFHRAAENAEAAAILACGGAAVCAAVDAELRARGEVAGDLAAFLRDVESLSREGRSLGNEDLRRLLEARSGRPWSSFFADHVEGRLEMPPSLFSALKVAPAEPGFRPEEAPSRPSSVSDWVFLAVAVAAVFIIPFVLEPYTMRPRKPGFLEKKLREED